MTRAGALACALALALTLAACAAGGPLPQPRPGSAGGAAPRSVEGAGGRPLALSVWGPQAPRAVILALHGFGDYGPSTFEAAARHWAERGIRTYAYDQSGFGRNPSRGRWPGAARLVADLRAVAAAIRARHPETPLAVVGHSMGGGVALAAAPGLAADGLVLAAPAIWGGDALPPLHRAAAWLAAAVVPDRRFTGEGVVRIRASDNVAALRRLAGDPLYLAPPSAREMMGLVRLMDRAAAAAPRADLPALLLLGRKDQIVPDRAVASVFARLPGRSAVLRYDEGWHLLFRDRQARRVRADVADWVLGLPPPEAAAPGPAQPPPGRLQAMTSSAK